MNDRYEYDPYGRPQQPQFLGYDEYGQPVYQQPQQLQQPQQPQQDYGYDPYGAAAGTGQQQPVYDPYADQGTYAGQPQQPQQDYGYDPYGAAAGTGQQQPVYDPYGPAAGTGQQQPVYDPYGPAAGTGQQQPVYDPYGPVTDTGGRVPHQAAPPEAEREYPAPRTERPPRDNRGDYGTGEFAFVEEEDEEPEDVIDWLKFTESRTERREEAKRRGRTRKHMLIVLLVLALVGGTGYLWYAGKLPGFGEGPGSTGPVAAEKRDVIVVHLRSTESDASSTALLVNNATAGEGTTLLLPNSLAVSTAGGGTTTLGESVEGEGATPTRDALNKLLGADIKSTWRLDTPYLENLVELVGGITLDTDASVPGEKKDDEPLVERGKGQSLDGRAAVAYATHRGTGEPQTKQLARFGQVMQEVLKKVSGDKKAATGTVESLGQILDPSLSQESLGALLAKLAGLAKDGSYETTPVPVQPDGTLSDKTSEGLVKDVLGGTVKNSDPDATPRVSVRNASGDEDAADAAQVTLVNGGYTVVGNGSGGTARTTSQVTYADAEHKAEAAEVAKTLGLPGDAVEKGKGAANADVTVVLGKDYEG